MRKIPNWAYSVGIRLFVGFCLLIGIALIWSRVQAMGRPVSHISTSVSQLAGFSQAVEMYALDNGAPPTTEQGLEALLRPPTKPPLPSNWDGPYLESVRHLPVDEWGRAFHYLSPGPNGEPFVVLSYGKDGRPGGSGEAADLIRPASDVE